MQVFDHNRWAAHRSTRRYVRHVLGMTSVSCRGGRGVAKRRLWKQDELAVRARRCPACMCPPRRTLPPSPLPARLP